MNARTIFKIIAVAGVPVTGYLSARGTMTKAEYIKKNGTPQTKKEKVKDNVRAYWPAAVSGAVTIGSILLADGLAAKEIAAATGIATAAVAKKDVIKGQFEKYRNVVKEDAGAEKDIQYMAKAAEVELDDDGEVVHTFKLYWLDKPIIFESTMDKVQSAINNLNKRLVDYKEGPGYATVTDFLNMVGHPELATNQSNTFGWDFEALVDNCDCYYLDFLVYKEADSMFAHGDEDPNTYLIDVVWGPYPQLGLDVIGPC